ncbi:hypothetical protein, partial [Faecalicatena contorta]|uniref:hypothetical protein n=1 Tax=Faecalicatena contorta TaxID=39482 RepID=UPI001F449A82
SKKNRVVAAVDSRMNIDVLTLFPAIPRVYFSTSIMARIALLKELSRGSDVHDALFGSVY